MPRKQREGGGPVKDDFEGAAIINDNKIRDASASHLVSLLLNHPEGYPSVTLKKVVTWGGVTLLIAGILGGLYLAYPPDFSDVV